MPEQDAPEATEAVLVSEVIPATRERIFAAWMSSEQHSAFTADSAVIEPTVGGKHTTFGGYASGITTALDPFRRIVQTWRSTDFPKSSPDSVLEITLEETVGGTLVTLLHSGIPSGQSDQYREAWGRYYLEPLKRYFTGRLSNGVHAADTRALSARRKRGASRPIATAAKAGAKAGARKAGRSRPAGKTAATGKKPTGAGRPGKKSARIARTSRPGSTARTRVKTAQPGARLAGKVNRSGGAKASSAKAGKAAQAGKAGLTAKGPTRASAGKPLKTKPAAAAERKRAKPLGRRSAPASAPGKKRPTRRGPRR